MIHSEGVAFNGIDIGAARERGVFVCNSKGCNAGAVAEQAVMLMLELLRQGLTGDAAVREGMQMEVKEYSMVHGITELSECAVGLIGFGDIAKATALRLHAFGCPLCYYASHRRDPEEARYHVSYLPLEELAEKSDIVSFYTAVTGETRGMVDRDFLARMEPTAHAVNTARGEIVDNGAMRETILSEPSPARALIPSILNPPPQTTPWSSCPGPSATER